MRTFKLILQYDGSRYRGWQRLPDCDRTIQGRLEQTLTKLLDDGRRRKEEVDGQ